MAKHKIKSIPTINRHHNTLLVVGSGHTAWDDLEAWWEFEHPHDVCTVNEMGLFYPCKINHVFSYHLDYLKKNKITAEHVHTVSKGGKGHAAEFAWRLRDKNGSSGLMAVKCALMYWGYKRVVVAGCPIDNFGHAQSLSGSGDSYRYQETFLKAWQRFHGESNNRVRSMSGNTKEIYGPPTKEWLNNVNNC